MFNACIMDGGGMTFTLECAKNMVLVIKNINYEMSHIKLEKCFIFSMMTVTNEVKNIHKYSHLYFVEFLEFICRITIEGLLIDDLIEYKVDMILELLFEKYYDTG